MLLVLPVANSINTVYYGYSTRVCTDHSQPEVIHTKALHQASPFLQRMLLYLQNYDLSIHYVKGKCYQGAGTLIRSHQQNTV